MDCLLQVLDEFQVYENLRDKLIWKQSSSGIYSPKLYCWTIFELIGSENAGWMQLWKGLFPFQG